MYLLYVFWSVETRQVSQVSVSFLCRLLFMFDFFKVLQCFAAVLCPHEGLHTGDQLGADHVQLSLRTNGPSGNCLFPTTLSSHPSTLPAFLPPSIPPSLAPYPLQCVYLTLLTKTPFKRFYRFGHMAKIAVCGDSFLEIVGRLKCLWIDGDLFHGFHM